MRPRGIIWIGLILGLFIGISIAGDEPKPVVPEAAPPAGPARADTDHPAAPPAQAKESPAVPAAPAPEPAAPEAPAIAAVRERANLFMKSKCNNQTDVCYTLLTKNIRSKITMVQFIQSSTVTISRYELLDIVIDPANGNHATVDVQYDTSMLGYSFKNRKIAQQWFFEDNNWFMELELGNPFRMATKKASDEAGKKPNIDPETLKKIQEMARKLKMDPNQGGPPVKPGPTQTPPPEEPKK